LVHVKLRWTQQQRVDCANDLTLVLLAVDRAANRAKCDDRSEEWMPPDKRYRCSHEERFATILATATSTRPPPARPP
jgi:hypothetical protein